MASIAHRSPALSFPSGLSRGAARLLRTPGWRRQLLIFAAAYLAYGLGRWVLMGSEPVAVANAHWIVDLERSLAIDVEVPVQDALAGTTWLWLLNHVYLAAQFVVTPAVLVWLYRSSPSHYGRLRDTVLLTWMVALPIYALFPVAPPRLADIGLVDTISSQTGVAMDSRFATALYNPLAAVPSLHAGFALAVSAVAFPAARSRLGRAAALLWAPLVALSVVATGNHFVFDIAAGALVTAVGYGFARAAARNGGLALPRRRPAARASFAPSSCPEAA